MPWGVAAAAIAAGGAIISSDASKSAAGTQANAAQQSALTQKQMFDQVNNQQAPYRSAGSAALTQLRDFLGFGIPQATNPQSSAILRGNLAFDEKGNYLGRFGHGDKGGGTLEEIAPTWGVDQVVDETGKSQWSKPGLATTAQQTPNTGSFVHQFNADDLKTNLAPNYDFMLKQGQGATTNLSNLAGGAFSGNTLKAINDYTQNYASNAYQNAFQNYNTNQTNIYNRLASIAGLGQTAGSNSTTGASAFSGGIGDAISSAGTARAAGQVGSANALSQGASNAMGWYTLGNVMNGGGGQNGGYDPNFTGDASNSMMLSG